MSRMALVSGVNYADIADYVHDFKKPYGTDQTRLVELWRENAVTPSYLMPILLRVHDDLFALMANHEYGFSAINADEMTAAMLKARAEIKRQAFQMVGFELVMPA